MTPLFVTAATIVTALGRGRAATMDALREGRSGLRRSELAKTGRDTYMGAVDGVDDVQLPPGFEAYDCRNNRLAELALTQDGFLAAAMAARERHGAARVGVYLGTTSSGILDVERAYRHRDATTGELPPIRYAEVFNLYSVARYVREALRLQGPAVVVSAACASSAKVFASAARAIAAGLCDAAIVGGVETFCLTTLHGFAALELLSDSPCRPCDRDRNGISLGEGAGFALLEADRAYPAGLAFLGYGESADAFHMSTPHPEGRGAALAMRAALAAAGLAARDIGYVNMHGTGTPNNDAAEDIAICSVLGRDVPRSSTKGATGHALGAAGIVEAVITLSHPLPTRFFRERSTPCTWIP